jgi:transglutaminase-like putative cysteine protease
MFIRIGYDIALRLPFPVGGHWHTFDARHNRRRTGRVLIGRGRDAGDVPITMVFGHHLLETFRVITEEIDPGNTAKAARRS